MGGKWNDGEREVMERRWTIGNVSSTFFPLSRSLLVRSRKNVYLTKCVFNTCGLTPSPPPPPPVPYTPISYKVGTLSRQLKAFYFFETETSFSRTRKINHFLSKPKKLKTKNKIVIILIIAIIIMMMMMIIMIIKMNNNNHQIKTWLIPIIIMVMILKRQL